VLANAEFVAQTLKSFDRSVLLKALGETSELEALFAMLSPEQFQEFLNPIR
jgi:hypothetical protein